MIALRRTDERGVSISMIVMALTIVAMIMLYIGTQTMNSLYTARKKSDRSVGMAAGDSGIEKYRVALQSHLADETNGFLLDKAALDRLVNQQPGTAVLENRVTSTAAGMSDVLVAAPYQYTVRETGTDTDGYWQLYNVITPRYLNAPARPASPLVVYIRAWATKRGSTSITTQPRVFRVEYRPSYISDYQSVTDAPFFFKDNQGFVIDGPIHSNGYVINDWLVLDRKNVPQRGIWLDKAPNCTGRASFTTSQGANIRVPGSSCSAAVKASSKESRQISLLGIEDMYAYMDSRCSTKYVRCFNNAGPYTVQLGSQQISVNGAVIPLVAGPDSGTVSVLLDDETTVRGSLKMPSNRAGRVTIAVRRKSATDRQPQVILAGTGDIVGAATPTKDTVAIVNQGDIVLEPRPRCIRSVNIAAIAQAGAITIAPEFVTLAPPAVNLSNRSCTNATPFYGSFSGHGQFIPSILWPDVRTGGFTPAVGYTNPTLRYNPNLYLNPPPFFPTALPWAVGTAKDADQRCLTATTAGDPSCK